MLVLNLVFSLRTVLNRTLALLYFWIKFGLKLSFALKLIRVLWSLAIQL